MSGIPRAEVEGIDKPVSRVVLGTMLAEDGPQTFDNAMQVFDAYAGAGGNCFDSAHKYGDGNCDRVLGKWIEERGNRNEIVVIAKGAHTPNCDPASITRQLLESLERMGTDHADLYFMHRDNPEVPAGEFVDVLDEHRRAGRMLAFGGSNWTHERVDEANAYAAARGIGGFTVLSNQFSLARMVQPTFPGCLSASEPDFVEWLSRNAIDLFAWSSQAAGFFSGAGAGELTHAWASPENVARRDRARQLGEKIGCTPVAIALAWVLRHPLGVFPIIGPRTTSELATSLSSTAIELSDDEMRWLEHG